MKAEPRVKPARVYTRETTQGNSLSFLLKSTALIIHLNLKFILILLCWQAFLFYCRNQEPLFEIYVLIAKH